MRLGEKHRTQKSRQKSPSGHHRTTLLGYIFAIKAPIDNRRKHVKQQYVLHMSWQYGELRPTSGWDPFTSLGHHCKFQRLSRLGSVTARHSSNGRQPNFAALNRGRHLCSAGRPSRWALAHILVFLFFYFCMFVFLLWSPYVIGQTIIFLPCSFFLLSSIYLLFFPRLILAAVDRMSAILLHTAWP